MSSSAAELPTYEDAPAPLTDRERSMLKRMFSDYWEVPGEWKTALKADLERDPPILGRQTLGAQGVTLKPNSVTTANIVNQTIVVQDIDPLYVDGLPTVPSLRTLGTGAQQAAAGKHAAQHQPGGADAMAVDAAPGTGSLRTLGTGANQAAAGNDSRFSAGSGLPADTVVAAGTRIIANKVLAGNAQSSWRVLGDGRQEWGPGTGSLDTALYRVAPPGGGLKTDSSLLAAQFVSGANGIYIGTAANKKIYEYGPTVIGVDSTFICTSGYIQSLGIIYANASLNVYDSVYGWESLTGGGNGITASAHIYANNSIVAAKGGSGNMHIRSDTGQLTFGVNDDVVLYRYSGTLRLTTTGYIDSVWIKSGEGWNNVTYVNSWGGYAAPFYGVQFRKSADNFVHMRGLATGGTAYASICQLPSGYRPAAGTRVIFNQACNGGRVRIDVADDGYCYMVDDGLTGSAVSWCSFAGITFYAES